MDEIEEFFKKMMQDNMKEMVNVLKITLLKEVCESCYDILLNKAMENKDISSDELYQEILTKLEKDDAQL